LTFSQVHVGSVAKFIFEIASDPETDERFRKALYEMYKTYERQIRAAGRDVDLSHIEEGDSEEDCCATKTCDVNNKGATEEDNETCQKEEAAAEPETPVETKSDKKKKKKKKSKKKVKELEEAETLQEEEKIAEVSTPKTNSSSKKKKKKKGNDDKENVTSEDITAQYDGSATKKSAKKRSVNDESTPKSKKKKQRSSSPSVDPHSMPSPDQVIDPASSDADETPSGKSVKSRRVSFGTMNHCKSHKASMKAIKTLNKDRWDTATKTPEKGILSKTPLKGKSSAKESSKKASSKKRKSKK